MHAMPLTAQTGTLASVVCASTRATVLNAQPDSDVRAGSAPVTPATKLDASTARCVSSAIVSMIHAMPSNAMQASSVACPASLSKQNVLTHVRRFHAPQISNAPVAYASPIPASALRANSSRNVSMARAPQDV